VGRTNRDVIAGGIASILLFLSLPTIAADVVRFVAIGDMPYTDAQAIDLDNEIKPKIRAGGFPFAIHYGDFKSGGDDCNGTELRAAYKQVMDLLPGRVFFTPGDNDWTDCDRNRLARPISELKRLAELREVFFGESLSIAESIQVRRQKSYPENAMWRFGGIQFLTLHVVGTNNGRIEVKQDDVTTAIAAVWARDTANADWLRRAIEGVEDDQSIEAVIVAMQADPTKINWDEPCTIDNPHACDGFMALRNLLISWSAKLEKPMLVIHGDTGDYCVDREFGGSTAPNLWRLNGAGDYTFDATVIEFRSDEVDRPFRFRRLLNNDVLNNEC
jgi:hypothetical protein